MVTKLLFLLVLGIACQLLVIRKSPKLQKIPFTKISQGSIFVLIFALGLNFSAVGSGESNIRVALLSLAFAVATATGSIILMVLLKGLVEGKK